MTTFKLQIAYDGTCFHGWQRQPQVPTVQGELEAAMTRMNHGQPMELRGASRTDSGVHAEGQLASFDYDGNIDARAWFRGLNALTPRSISVRSITPTYDGFHPRFASRGKHYRYMLWQGSAPSPMCRPWTWCQWRNLDLDAMQRAAEHLLGEHDFTSFRATDCQSQTATRKITHVDISPVQPDGWTYTRPYERNGLVAFNVKGNAFLKYMIRIITGTLVEVGVGRYHPDALRDMLAARDRRAAGRTAPPHGLTLVEVFHDPFADAASDANRARATLSAPIDTDNITPHDSHPPGRPPASIASPPEHDVDP